MTRQQQAHLRLMSSGLPIRTHHAKLRHVEENNRIQISNDIVQKMRYLSKVPGITRKEISERCGVSPNTVARYLGPLDRVISDETLDKILRMGAEKHPNGKKKFSLHQIARVCGVSHSTVHKYLSSTGTWK